MLKQSLFLAALLLMNSAIAGTIYEWKDPVTGALKAGDKPPGGGVEYWVEGHRPQPGARTLPVEQGMRIATKEEISDCLEYTKAKKNYKDPDSVKTERESLYGRQADGSYSVTIWVNAKNSYGAYSGASLSICTYRANGSLDSVKVF